MGATVARPRPARAGAMAHRSVGQLMVWAVFLGLGFYCLSDLKAGSSIRGPSVLKFHKGRARPFFGSLGSQARTGCPTERGFGRGAQNAVARLPPRSGRREPVSAATTTIGA